MKSQPSSSWWVARTADRAKVFLTTTSIPLVQAAIAAGLAWFIAHDLIGHRAPIFAPVGALLILSNAPGRRTTRVLTATLGALVGVAVGDLLVHFIGVGAIQVAVVPLLAMSVAAILGGSPTLVTNAGIAAVLIATVEPPHGLYSDAAFRRLVDVLIGGATSLAVTVLLPAHTLTSTRREAQALMTELEATLTDVASALQRHDADAAEQGLERARGLDLYCARLRHESDLAHEAVLPTSLDGQRRLLLARYKGAVPNLELAIRNARVLARVAVRVIETDPPAGVELAQPVRDLATAVPGVHKQIELGAPEGPARTELAEAAHLATAAAAGGASVPVGALVTQIRATSVDLLQAAGLQREAALKQVRLHDSPEQAVNPTAADGEPSRRN